MATPPRKSSDPLSETVTKVRADGPSAPFAPDTIKNGVHDALTIVPETEVIDADGLDWEEEEESTHVFHQKETSSPPPAPHSMPGRPSGAGYPAYSRGSAPPPSSRPPRLVPPSAPSKSTLLGVHPSDLRPPAPPVSQNGWVSSAGFPGPQPSANGAVAIHPELGDEQATVPRDPSGAQSNGYGPNGMGSNGMGSNGVGTNGVGTNGHAANGHGAFGQGAGNGAFSHTAPVGVQGSFPPGSQSPYSGAGYAQTPAPYSADPLGRLPSVRPPGGVPTELSLRKVGIPAVQPLAIGEPSSEGGSKRMALVIAVATALITAAAASAFLLIRRPGQLQVDVKGQNGSSVAVAEVYVDGKRVCESTPCIVRDLDAGPKSVRVVAVGYANEEPTTVEVGSGTMTTLPVTLKAALGTLIASSDQPGLRVFVDGTERGPLPARLNDIPPGTHQIRVAGGDRYKPLERAIEVKAGEPVDLGNVKLTVLRGKMTVALKTEGASITLIPNDDSSKAKVLDGPFPRAIEVETTSGTWKLVAKKKGLGDFVAPLDFTDGIAEKTLDVQLDKEPKEAKVAETPAPAPGPGPRPEPATPPSSKGSGDDSEKPAADKGGMGFLNINSLPVSRILLDGQPMGETPKTGVQVTPGTHTITFINPDLPKKSVSVTVKAGETKTASAKLRD